VPTVDLDPAAAGVDPERLARIDTHLRRYVDEGRLAGWQVHVTRRGQTVHSSVHGSRDLEAGLPVEQDTLWRIYSMTKPVTSVVAMQLYEQGRIRLNDEVSRYVPEFADMRVLVGGNVDQPKTVPATEPVRLWHLLTHTAGLTYAFTRSSVLDDLYRARRPTRSRTRTPTSRRCASAGPALPLLFEPGHGLELLGRHRRARPRDRGGHRPDARGGFAEQVFGPLGMTQTRWWVDGDDVQRLAALYVPHPATGQALRYDAMGRTPCAARSCCPAAAA
jgi:CubicO group peptidase (beta-lactamase class C family)